MPTLLIKNVSEDLLRELKRLKIDLGCKTWAELLEKLVKSSYKGFFAVSDEELKSMREAVNDFLRLRTTISEMWRGPSVLEEFRRARRHEG
ncbi:MAG: hypothetical protein DRJ60_06000 [Thermoprotei archaeon]|nr:MAG: hypothetical protein DRJ60_06000 [Thermoprotei archaeon]